MTQGELFVLRNVRPLTSNILEILNAAGLVITLRLSHNPVTVIASPQRAR